MWQLQKRRLPRKDADNIAYRGRRTLNFATMRGVERQTRSCTPLTLCAKYVCMRVSDTPHHTESRKSSFVGATKTRGSLSGPNASADLQFVQ